MNNPRNPYLDIDEEIERHHDTDLDSRIFVQVPEGVKRACVTDSNGVKRWFDLDNPDYLEITDWVRVARS